MAARRPAKARKPNARERLPDGSVRVLTASGDWFVIDAEDEWRLGDFSWNVKCWSNTPKRYVQRTARRLVDGRYVKYGVTLHRLIAGAADGQYVDHRDGDTLNNRRCNLRLCSARENAANRGRNRNRPDRYKGAYFVARVNRWSSAISAGPIRSNGKRARIHLGMFATAEEAARAYDAAALKHFGEFAALNFPQTEAA